MNLDDGGGPSRSGNLQGHTGRSIAGDGASGRLDPVGEVLDTLLIYDADVAHVSELVAVAASMMPREKI